MRTFSKEAQGNSKFRIKNGLRFCVSKPLCTDIRKFHLKYPALCKCWQYRYEYQLDDFLFGRGQSAIICLIFILLTCGVHVNQPQSEGNHFRTHARWSHIIDFNLVCLNRSGIRLLEFFKKNRADTRLVLRTCTYRSFNLF